MKFKTLLSLGAALIIGGLGTINAQGYQDGVDNFNAGRLDVAKTILNNNSRTHRPTRLSATTTSARLLLTKKTFPPPRNFSPRARRPTLPMHPTSSASAR